MLGGKSRSKILSIHPSGGVTGAGRRVTMRTSVVSSMSRSFSRISRSTSTECRSLQSSLARRASKRNDALCSPVGICSSATLISPGESVAAIGARRCVRARLLLADSRVYARAGCAGADLVRSFNSGRCPVEWHRRVATPTAKTDFSGIKKSIDSI